MGAVRDMTEAEDEALRWACARRGVSCVSCNLGRTAEFTSKVIMALNGHHKCGQVSKHQVLDSEFSRSSTNKLLVPWIEEKDVCMMHFCHLTSSGTSSVCMYVYIYMFLAVFQDAVPDLRSI